MTPRTLVAILSLILAAAPFIHSAWNYHWARFDRNLPPVLQRERMDAAFEWSGWKIACTGIALILNTVVDIM